MPRPLISMGISALLLAGLATFGPAQDRPGADAMAVLQDEAVATKNQKRARAYHFGSQGPNDIFSNHTSHSNRLVPVYTFGRKIDLSSVTGSHSSYRDLEKVRTLYGRLPDHTVNPEANYADQSDLYRVQKEAVERGVKHLFIIWFDGMDWETTQAAAVARSGQAYAQGKGSGLLFQNYNAEGSSQYGFMVTSPAYANVSDKLLDVDQQTVGDLSGLLGGGYDARFGGQDPWTRGPLFQEGPGYLRGQSASKEEKAAIVAAGGVVHAYTDSAPSAGQFATGVKQYDGSINVASDGRFAPTLFNQLQGQGWKVGTVTNVPFDHASPAAFYAHNVSRDDYQDLAREMLGLESIAQETGKSPKLPGLDVVIGCGWGAKGQEADLKSKQGANAVAGNTYITEADLKAIDVNNGGACVVVQRESGVDGTRALGEAAASAIEQGKRLFGFFGLPVSGHLPFRTANGDYLPSKGIRGAAERYSQEDLKENPKLVDMTRAALAVLGRDPKKSFALFVEAGDVDFALHDNNLDNTIGAVLEGEEAFRAIVEWVESKSNWDESAVIVTADHGHHLVVDDPAKLAGAAR